MSQDPHGYQQGWYGQPGTSQGHHQPLHPLPEPDHQAFAQMSLSHDQPPQPPHQHYYHPQQHPQYPSQFPPTQQPPPHRPPAAPIPFAAPVSQSASDYAAPVFRTFQDRLRAKQAPANAYVPPDRSGSYSPMPGHTVIPPAQAPIPPAGTMGMMGRPGQGAPLPPPRSPSNEVGRGPGVPARYSNPPSRSGSVDHSHSSGRSSPLPHFPPQHSVQHPPQPPPRSPSVDVKPPPGHARPSSSYEQPFSPPRSHSIDVPSIQLPGDPSAPPSRSPSIEVSPAHISRTGPPSNRGNAPFSPPRSHSIDVPSIQIPRSPSPAPPPRSPSINISPAASPVIITPNSPGPSRSPSIPGSPAQSSSRPLPRPLPPTVTSLERSDTVSSVVSLDRSGFGPGRRPLPRTPIGVNSSKSLDRGLPLKIGESSRRKQPSVVDEEDESAFSNASTSPLPTIVTPPSINEPDKSPAKFQPLPTFNLPDSGPASDDGSAEDPGDVQYSGLPVISVSTEEEPQRIHASGSGAIICAGCRQPIIGRIVNAMKQRFHPQCFGCNECGELLEHVSSYEWEGRAYCHLDYHDKFAYRCHQCKTPIVDTRFVTLNDPVLGQRYYHELHFFCSECGEPFLDPSKSSAAGTEQSGQQEEEGETNPFVIQKGHPYCERCHLRLHKPKCKGCTKPIPDVAVSALGARWHKECFVCSSCSQQFPNSLFFPKDGKALCTSCWEEEQ